MPSLPGKYFIALLPPEPLQSSIMQLKQRMRDTYNTKGALRSPAHITLHMPFEWKENKEEQLISGLSGFSFAQKEIPIRLKNYNSFEPRVIFIDVERNELLDALQRELVQHVKSKLTIFNQADDRRGFHPHITVAFRDLKKQVFYEAWNTLQHENFTTDFTCGSFFLLKQAEQQWIPYHEFKLNPVL